LVVDSVGADAGFLMSWSLSIETPNTAGDCNGNGIPDDCEDDCDNDGTPDDCEDDCNSDGTPDDCEVDCNNNGTPDECEVLIPPTTKLYEQSPDLAIPNNNPAGVSTTINVPDHGVIDTVVVSMWIDHDEQGDIRATLLHNGVPVMLINRAGSNAGGCGPSIYGYAADDFGSSAVTPLVLDDTAGVGIDCYAGPGVPGTFNYTGPASPSQSLGAYHDMDKYGEWTLIVSDHLFYNSGALKYWSLTIYNAAQGDCNANGIPDECDIASGYSTDANGNGIPDECEIAIVPGANVVSAVSRKSCELDILPRTSEPRVGGVDFVDVVFDIAVPSCDALLEWAPCSGGDYAAYTGSAGTSCFAVGEHLYLNFTPGLENYRRYRVSIGAGTTSVAGQSVEFRTLLGDVNADGVVDGTDRSIIVGVWTGSGFTCGSDLNDDSFTNAADRSTVVGVWTSGQNTCPW
jgi:subtilisin-like proprotein convertase family protein